MMNRKTDWNAILRSTAAALLALQIGACAKVREAAWGEGEKETIFEIREIEGGEARLELDHSLLFGSSGAEQRADGNGESQYRSEGDLLDASAHRITSLEAPSRLKPLFRELKLQALPGQQSSERIRFRVDSRAVTAYRVIAEPSLMPALEAQLLVEGERGERWLPVFQVPVQQFGRAVRAKNDLGEETQHLWLKPVEWKSATHVRIGTLSSDRIAVSIEEESLSELFTRASIDGRLGTVRTLEENLKVRTGLSADARIHTRVNGSALEIEEIVSADTLNGARKNALESSRDAEDPVRPCTREQAEYAKLAIESCVVVLRASLDVDPVSLKRARDEQGNLAAAVSIEPAPGRTAGLLRVRAHSLVRALSPEEEIPGVEHGLLEVDSLTTGRWLMRLMLSDAPADLDGVMQGSQSPLESVVFRAERGRLVVVRARPLVLRSDLTRVDLEPLMSYRTRYYERRTEDEQGNALSRPRFVEVADPRGRKELLAEVDWTSNELEYLEAPLTTMGVRHCFGGAALESVDSLRWDAGKRVLAFSLRQTHTGGLSSYECVGGGGSPFSGGERTNYEFETRISFVGEGDGSISDRVVQDLPYDAQKRLGFAFFNQNIVRPNDYGNVGREGSLQTIPMVHDLAGGKTIRYVLTGLEGSEIPAEYREAIVEATREVIADWNRAFSRALEGSALERGAEVIELVVESGEVRDSGAARLGDLDVNQIRILPKASQTGVVGVGGPSANPATGRIENASVSMYVGNILSALEYVRESAVIQDAYREFQGDSAASKAPSKAAEVVRREAARARSTIPGKDDPNSVAALVRGVVEASVRRDPRAFRAAIVDGSSAERVRGMLMRGQCAMQWNDRQAAALLRAGAGKVGEWSDLQLFKAYYRDVLAHELGHNLGLRHNFRGSMDAANFRFAGEDDSVPRNYSSIMDYQSDTLPTYSGPGPHDVAALRLGYTGRVEIDPEYFRDNQVARGSFVGVKDVSGQAVLPASEDGLISLETLLLAHSTDGKHPASWTRVSAVGLKRAGIPIRDFRYCTDEDRGSLSMCAAFDRGTTPLEAVRALREDYLSSYALRHFAGDRIHFGRSRSWTGFLSALQTFSEARQVLEEGARLQLAGVSQEELLPWWEAAFEARNFLEEVIRAPDYSELPFGGYRSGRIKLEENGDPIGVELRFLHDIAMDDVTDRLHVRGFELDKIAALLVLTQTFNPDPNAVQSSVSASFTRFEFDAGLEAEKGRFETLPTPALLAELIAGRLTPAVRVPKNGSLAPLGGLFQASVTSLMRNVAVKSGVMSLDETIIGRMGASGGPVSFNPSTYFRVERSRSIPSGVPSIPDRNQRRLFPSAGGLVSAELVSRAAAIEAIRTSSAGVRTLVREFLLASISQAGNPDDAEAAARVGRLREAVRAALAALPARHGSIDPDALARISGQAAGILLGVVSDAQSGAIQQPELIRAISELRIQVSELVSGNPALALFVEAIPTEVLPPELLELVYFNGEAAIEREGLLDTLTQMADLFRSSHPELFDRD